MTRTYDLEPVGDLVLRAEHRPVVRELDVRQVVVPDRVVQAQRLVPVAPLVTGARVLVDDDRRHAELAQAGAERDAALAAADHQDVRLGARTRAPRPPRPARPARSAGRGTRRARPPDGGRACGSSWPLSSSSVVSSVHAPSSVSRSGPRPRPTAVSNAIQAVVTPSASSAGSVVGNPLRVGRVEGGPQQVGDPVAALDGLEVPGERDQVPPEAGGGEHPGGPVDVPGGQCRLEVR